MEAGSVSVSRGLDTDTATLEACTATLDWDEDEDGSFGLVMLAVENCVNNTVNC